MSTKKVTIINEGLLKNDTQSSNKDRLREEFGSWYSRVSGFKFIKSTSDMSFEMGTPNTVEANWAGPSPDFYKFKQKVIFSQDVPRFGIGAGDEGDIDELKENLRNGILNKVRWATTHEDFAADIRLPIAKEEVFNVGKAKNLSGYAGVDFFFNYTDKGYERLLNNPAVTEVVVPSMYAQVTRLKNQDTEENTLKSPTRDALALNLKLKPGRRKFKRQMVIGDPISTLGPYEDNKHLFPFHAEVQLPLGHNSEVAQAIQGSDLGAVLMRDFAENINTNTLESIDEETLSYSIDYFPANGGNKTNNFTVNFKTMNLNDWWAMDLPVWADTRPPMLPKTSMFVSDELTVQEELASRDDEATDIWNMGTVATLGIPTLQGKLTNLMEKHARTYDEIITGETSYSESLLYKVAKYKGRQSSGNPIQEFFIYNSTDEDAVLAENRKLSFIDTQLKLDSAYTYVVTEFRAIVGTRYKYDRDSLSTVDDMWLAEDNKIKGAFEVEVEPVVKLIELPLFRSTGRILAPPPMSPDVDVISYKGVSNKMMFFFNSHIGTSLEEPISFGEEEGLNNRQYLLHEKTSDSGMILYNTSDAISFVEVYRTAQRPDEIEDFEGQLLETVSMDMNIKTDLTAGSMGRIIKQKPNKKFYYMFRSLGRHGEASNPSPVYEIELFNDGGVVYPIVKIVDLEAVDPRTKTKSFKNLLRITPRMSQAVVNEVASGLVNENGELGNASASKIVLGVEDDSLFGKRFKIRLTSKKTGKKIDLNVAFKTGARRTAAESSPSPDAIPHIDYPIQKFMP